MRLGLFGLRGDERGLARMTGAFYTHMRPERTVAIDMGRLSRPADFSRYPDAKIIDYNDGRLDIELLRYWLHELDVVYFAETPYDYRVFTAARDLGVRSVLHVMPEFYRHGNEPLLPRPDVFWAPTSWRLAELPAGTRHVPVPVEHVGEPSFYDGDGPLRVLHVIGRAAAHDRNGTRALFAALRYVKRRVHLTVVTQDRVTSTIQHRPRHVTVEKITGGLADHRDLYAGQHALVLPRRYGGLSLPVQEAMSHGLPVIMTGVGPQIVDWPVIGVNAVPAGRFRTQAGPVPLVTADVHSLAAAIDNLAGDPAYHGERAAASVEWAKRNSWAELEPLYRREIAAAIV